MLAKRYSSRSGSLGSLGEFQLCQVFPTSVFRRIYRREFVCRLLATRCYLHLLKRYVTDLRVHVQGLPGLSLPQSLPFRRIKLITLWGQSNTMHAGCVALPTGLTCPLAF